MNEALLRECASAIGHQFRDVTLLQLALTHSSHSAEHPSEPSNERLEFLGDAVIGLVLADEMYDRHADFDEGVLTDLRKSVVNAQTLSVAARRLGLGKFVRLGRGESTSGGSDKTSILANAFEAVIGAVYLDAGIAAAFDLSLRLLAPEIAGAVPGLRNLDPKTQLQELSAEMGLGAPTYVLEDEGPDHDKTFFAEVLVGGRRRGSGSGRSKKAAEQQAAAEAIQSLRTTG
ncbi:MAG: ribonuclease [Actinomycetota bacterium]